MILKIKQIISSILIIISLCIADQRHFVWTYEYKTVPKGEVEFEHYYTASYPDVSDLSYNSTIGHQFEIEIGMNEHYDMAIYHQFEQNNSLFNYKGYKIRWRLRFGSRNQFLLDPLLYLEYHGKPDFSDHEIETKIVLAKETNQFIISFNPILEIEIEDGNQEIETEYSLGISYKINEILNAGLEIKGGENGHYWGPVISHGLHDIWFSLGSAIALNKIKENKPELEIRMIMGVGIK